MVSLVPLAWTVLIFVLGSNMLAYAIGEAYSLSGIQNLAPWTPEQIVERTQALNATYYEESTNLNAFAFLANALFSNDVFSTVINTATGGIMLPLLQGIGAPDVIVFTIGLMGVFIVVGALTLIIRGMFA